jgi:hypothetical protein
MNATRVGIWLARVAGAMDFATGVGLVAAPAWTLVRMAVPVPGDEALLFVRFVGAFVGAVGASYLWAAARPRERLRVMLGLTVWMRVAAGTFTGVAVASGALAGGWLAVTATDWTLAVVQLWLVAKGAGRDE